MYEDIGHLIIKNMGEIKITETRISLNICFTVYQIFDTMVLLKELDKINFSLFDSCNINFFKKDGTHFGSETINNLTQSRVEKSIINTIEKDFTIFLSLIKK